MNNDYVMFNDHAFFLQENVTLFWTWPAAITVKLFAAALTE